MIHRIRHGSTRVAIVLALTALCFGMLAVPAGAQSTQTPEGFGRAWMILGQYDQDPAISGGTGESPGIPAIQMDYLQGGGVTEASFNSALPTAGQVVNTDFVAAASLSFNPGNRTDAGPPPTVFFHLDSDYVVDYSAVFGGYDQVMSYAWCIARNKTGSTWYGYLGVSSDDSIQVKVNGVEVGITNVGRGWGAVNEVQNAFQVTLNAGDNIVMIKVFEGTGGFGFACRLQSDDQIGVAPLGDEVDPAEAELLVYGDLFFTVNRTISDQYVPGGAGVPISLTATATGGGGEIVVTENVPTGVTPSNAVATAGLANIAGQTITWTVTLAAAQTATLTYDASVGASVCNEIYSLAGTFRKTGSAWTLPVTGDTVFTQQPDDLSGAPYTWATSNIPAGLQPAGSVDFYNCDSSYILHADGADIWDVADEFFYVYAYVLSGDFEIRGMVEMLPPVYNDWAKGGFMLRANLSQGSPHLIIATCNTGPALGGNHDIAFQGRDAQGGGSFYDGAIHGAPNNDEVYFIMRRVGTTVFVDYDNGEGTVLVPWQTYTPPNIPTAAPVLVGMALTSHSAGNLANCKFSGVQITAANLAWPYAQVVRTITGGYVPGGAPAQVEIAAIASATQGGPVVVTENLPTGLTGSNLVASAGTPSIAGQVITWNVTLAAAQTATLTYDAAAPGTACGTVYTLDGTYTMGVLSDITQGDTAVTQQSDGWDNSLVDWAGSIDIPATLTPEGRTDYYICDTSYVMWAAGADIWGTADEFHFLYAYVQGNFNIACTVDLLPPARNDWSKAGLMLRGNLTQGSPYIISATTNGGSTGAGNGDITFQYRNTQGGGALWPNDEGGEGGADNVDEVYLILRRTGTTVTADYDNIEGAVVIGWQTRETPGQTNIDPTQPNLVGLCLTSHASGALAAARFTNVSFAGIVPPPLPPDPPSGLTAAGIGTNLIVLNWVDNSNSETGFKIERHDDGANPTFAQIAQTGPGASSYVDSGLLTDGTVYTYRVRATNALGDSAYSNEASDEAGGEALDAARWTLYR